MKKCCKCKESKEYSEFYKQKSSKDGFGRQCKSCKKLSEDLNLNAERLRRYRKNNPDKSKHQSEAWRIKNQEYQRRYYEANKRDLLESRREYNRKYKNELYNSDEVFRLKCKLRAQVCSYLTGKNKSESTEKLIGYTVKQFIEMHGEGKVSYDLDHKIPLSWFKQNTPIDIIWNLSNLHWIPLRENRSKNNKYMTAVSDEYYELAAPYILEEYKTNKDE